MSTQRAITMGTVAVAAVIFFVWLTTSSLLKSEAFVSKVDISAQVVDSLLPMNERDVAFLVKPKVATDRISAVDLIVEVENGSLNGWTNCTSLESSSNLPFMELIRKTGSRARYSCALIKDKDQLPTAVTLRGSVSCGSSQRARVTVSGESEVAGPVDGTTYGQGDYASIEVQCDGRGGGEEEAGGPTNEDFVASFLDVSCEDVALNGTCAIDFLLKPHKGSKRISGVFVKLKYDNDILRMKSDAYADGGVLGDSTLLAQTNTGTTPTPTNAPNVIIPTSKPNVTPTGAVMPTTVVPTGVTPTSAVPTTALTPTTTTPTPTGAQVSPFPSISPLPSRMPPLIRGCGVVEQEIVGGQGVVLYMCNLEESQLPTNFSAQLTFDAVGEGSGTLSIASIQVVGPDSVGPYTVFKRRASYTIGEGGGGGQGNVELDMKLRLQCVVKKPKRNVPVKVRVGLGDGLSVGKTQYTTTEMKFDDRGHLVGKARFNVRDLARPYKVLVKYEYGMQKKVGSANPTEDFPGAYSTPRGNIQLKAGTNVLDFSKILMMTGDLPPEGQDGISNSKDLALVRNLIGKRDAESAELADVNFDGVVNAVDHSCMLAFVRWDEE